MGWGRFLLGGDYGQQMDINEQGETLRRLRQSVASRHSKDADQDMSIAVLWQENVNLKFALGSLVRLLTSWDVVRPEEIADVVAVLEQAEQPANDTGASQGDAQHPENSDGDATSPELAALGDAARDALRRPRG